MNGARPLGARLALVGLLLGSAPVMGSAARPGEVTLTPVDASSLIAGGRAELRWKRSFFLDLEEWEAFLSLDGGETWPVRLTPHLDRRVTRIVVDLPDVPSRRVRLLLRYGDERSERELEVPDELALAPAPGRAFAPPLPLSVRSAARPGESARAGGPGVVEWVEGTRAGGRLARFRFRPPGIEPIPLPELIQGIVGGVAAEEAPWRSSRPIAATRVTPRIVVASASSAQTRLDRGRRSTSTVLALLSRRNE